MIRQKPTLPIHGVMHRFSYRWTLKDAVFTKDKGKVFSCFACGGGKIAHNGGRMVAYRIK
jgi:hypothetical protein